jgi:hypothetical protein
MSYKEGKMEIVNKIGDEYFVICILGKADCEENKIFCNYSASISQHGV